MTREEFLKTFPTLIESYQPTPEVLHLINEVALLMLVGPSGVGKSTLIERLGLTFVPSDTTRLQRPGEEEGTDFFFRTDYDQLAHDIKGGAFVQVAIGPGGDFYATRESAYPKSGLAVMPIVADVVPIFRQLGFKETISAFVVPPTYEEWMHRLKSRSFTKDQLTKRLNEAKRSLNFALNDNRMHFILNDQLDDAVRQTKQLIEGKTDAQKEEIAKKTAKDLLDRIN